MSAQITLTITEHDFEHLHHTSMAWGKSWAKQKSRFEDAPLFTWKMAYWVENYVEVLLCQGFLSAHNFESQTVYDTAYDCWLILTDYKTESWS